MSGYARIHRSLIGHPAFRNDAEGMAFAWMVLRAAWKPCRVRYKGKAFTLARGQLSISQRDMAEAMDRDKAWIERLWKRLRAEAMIDLTYEAGAAVITICNYGDYQSDVDGHEAPNEAVNEADARQTQGTEQYIEEIKKKDVKPRKRAAPTADYQVPNWVPADPWAAFVAMRSRKKAPVDSYIAAKLFTKLERIRETGWDVAKVIDKATLNNWTDIYAPTAGRDDDMRADRPAANDAAPAPREQFEAVCDREIDRHRRAGNEREALSWERKKRGEPDRNGATGPPRSLGALVAGIHQQVAH